MNSLEDDPQFKNNCPSTIVLFGNGIVENGWEPYKQHLVAAKNASEESSMDFHPKNSPDLSLFIARHSFKQRFLKFKALETILAGDYIEHFIQHLTILNATTESIGQHYHNASQNGSTPGFRIRLDTEELLTQIMEGNSFAVITTNWDTLLFNHPFFGRNIIQLHGRCDIPASLILPTQFSIDELLLWQHVSNLEKQLTPSLNSKLSHLKQVLRPKEIVDRLYDGHLIAERLLRNAKRIVTWGLAFNPYDSELLSIMPIRWRNNDFSCEKLIIVNPDERHRDATAMAFGIYDYNTRLDIDPNRNREIIYKSSNNKIKK